MFLPAGDVQLRSPEPADVGPMTLAVRASLPELQQFMPWARDDYSERHAAQWVAGEVEPGAVQFLVVSPDGIVGGCGLNGISERDNVANLGYWVSSGSTGRGYATSAARALAQHGFEQLGFDRIKLYMSTHNLGSKRVAEKIGATGEGLMRSRLLLNGERHDAYLYSLLPGEVR